MADIRLGEAAAALREHFGPQIIGTKLEGLDRMTEALRERLGASRGEAKEIIEALERGHSIEWVERGHATGTVAQATMPFGEALGAENPAGPATSAEAPLDVGYWQL